MLWTHWPQLPVCSVIAHAMPSVYVVVGGEEVTRAKTREDSDGHLAEGLLCILLQIYFHDLLTCILFHHGKICSNFLPGMELEGHD